MQFKNLKSDGQEVPKQAEAKIKFTTTNAGSVPDRQLNSSLTHTCQVSGFWGENSGSWTPVSPPPPPCATPPKGRQNLWIFDRVYRFLRIYLLFQFKRQNYVFLKHL